MSFKSINELDLFDVNLKKCSNEPQARDVWYFFKRFEKDSNPDDLTLAEESYFRTFLFCDPGNADSVKKADFLKFLPIMAAKYKELGFKEKAVKKIRVIKLNENYLLADVIWKMKFEKNGKVLDIDDIRATYILKNEEDGYKIIFQLDHQNPGDLI